MLSGYEFELADEIHRERLRQAAWLRQRGQRAANSSGRFGNWMASVRSRMGHLHLFRQRGGKMQSSRMMQ